MCGNSVLFFLTISAKRVLCATVLFTRTSLRKTHETKSLRESAKVSHSVGKLGSVSAPSSISLKASSSSSSSGFAAVSPKPASILARRFLVVDLRQSMPYTRIPGTRAYGAPVCAKGPSATQLKMDYKRLIVSIIINCLLFASRNLYFFTKRLATVYVYGRKVFTKMLNCRGVSFSTKQFCFHFQFKAI